MKKVLLLCLVLLGGVNVNAEVTYTIYVESSEAPNLYVWDGNGVELTGGWPGTTLSETEVVDGVTFYKWTTESTAEKINVIFNGVSGQTSDIKNLTPGTYYYYYDYYEGTEYSQVRNATFVVAGNNTTLFGEPSWDVKTEENALTYVGNKTYSKTYTNVSFNQGDAVEFKIVKDNTDWLPASDNSYFEAPYSSTYNVTFKFTYTGNNTDAGTTVLEDQVELTADYYYLGDANSWTPGKMPLVADGTKYSYNFINNSSDEYFAIMPKDAYDRYTCTLDWSKVIRPVVVSDDYELSAFQIYKDNTIQGDGKSWKITEGFADFNFTFDSSDNTFTVTPYRTATIGPAGYITYSNGEKCVVSGAKAYTVSANNTSSVTMTEMAAETVWPESAGMILGGSYGDEVTISAVASDATTSEIGDNLLKGTGNSTATPDKENVYVFSWNGSDPSTVGFYKASGNGELAAHKAYLDLSTAGAKTADFLSFDFGGETTSINSIENGELRVENYDYYNLAGQKVNKDYKGIVIVNGKKYLRK